MKVTAHPSAGASQDSSPSLTRQQGFLLNTVLIAWWGLWVLLNVVSSGREHVLQLGLRERVFWQALTPQGWGFFTRNPRDAWIHAYLLDAGGGLHAANAADLRHVPWNGAKRTVRSREGAIVEIASKLPKKAWTDCTDAVERCAKQADSSATIVTSLVKGDAALCGRVLLQRVATVPWAWRDTYRTTPLPSLIALLTVQCEHNRAAS